MSLGAEKYGGYYWSRCVICIELRANLRSAKLSEPPLCRSLPVTN